MARKIASAPRRVYVEGTRSGNPHLTVMLAGQRFVKPLSETEIDPTGEVFLAKVVNAKGGRPSCRVIQSSVAETWSLLTA